MTTKLSILELPSDEELDGMNNFGTSPKIAFLAASEWMRDTHAAPLREALVLAVEALEKYKGYHIEHYLNKGAEYPANEALAEIQKILNTKEK